jgi:hypothetical protein
MNQIHRAAPALSHGRIVICLVAAVLLALPVTAQQAPATPALGAAIAQSHVTFPACAAVIDITKPPYNAKGDGRTDDSDTIQKALTDTMGAHKILYFPNGTYLVSRTLRYTKKDSRGGDAWGFNWLQGQSEAGTIIRLKDGFFARNVTTSGYQTAMAAEGEKGDAGPIVAEYMTGTPTSPFGGPVHSLNLPVEETPEVPWDETQTWALVEAPTDGSDASGAIQGAVDSGATTVFLASPQKIVLKSPVTIRGKVRRVIGCGNEPDYFRASRPDLIIADGDAPVVIFEHFANINGGVVVDTERTVVFRGAGTYLTFRKKCDVFLEDFCGRVEPLPGQRIWARQLNTENQGTHLLNDNATVWILGYKTERGGTLIHTTNGGRTELFGTFSYTTTAGKLAPMFVTEDASAFVYFNEVCYTGDPFATLVRETRHGVTRTIERGQGGISPYVGVATGTVPSGEGGLQ